MKHSMALVAYARSKSKYLAFICMLCLARASVQYDVHTIIQRSVDANRADWKAAPAYDYFERDQENGGTKTYEETMILGSPYERLVAANGKPLTSNEQAAEQHKLDEVTAQRRQESSEQRARRVAKYEKDRKRDQLLMNELANAFDFRLLGQQKLGPYEVYVLKATPRAGYEPPNMEAQVLTGMQGKLWIDKNTFQWVKVEAQVIHPVSIEGFLARVEPGTHFELEKMQVTDGVWLPKHFAMKSRAKILFLLTHTTQEDETYFDYHQSSSNGQRSLASER
jgi:hypothetical protein